MRILLCTVPFKPLVGGLETVSGLLADCFSHAGHEVTLVTRTRSDALDTAPYRIVRDPSSWQLARLVRDADVVFHNNISLRFAWPLLWLRRPWVVVHHVWIPNAGLAGRIKRLVLRQAVNVAVSGAIAASLPVPCTVVPNPYADDVFRLPDERTPRDKQLVFIGRLIPEKGVDVLLRAIQLLAVNGRRLHLEVVGTGPEEAALRRLAHELGIASQVSFPGRRTGHELATLLAAHRVIVVPSVWDEPFGMVCLEAMACGCVPVVARSGGLPEAVGAAGAVVARADPAALAEALDRLIDDEPRLSAFRELAPAQLAKHTRERVGRQYLQILEAARRGRPHGVAALHSSGKEVH
jgi:glycosyltransferase involved in cell wall biosynthesis